MIMAGDAFHNFTDGVIIASAFLADVKLGIVTALAIIAHEIPQEIGDFLIVSALGFSKRKALVVNALSGLANVTGALIAYFALSQVEQWIPEILAIAAASMIYVAVADLIPGLHKRTALGESAHAGRLHRAGHRQHLGDSRGTFDRTLIHNRRLTVPFLSPCPSPPTPRNPPRPANTTQQVMSGFADAYRAWIEAMSAKPETMLDLQGRFMQEQMKLWMKTLDPKSHGMATSRPTSASAVRSGTSCRCSAISAIRTCSPRR
jgi:hypothetical protein